jgi:hypothetical protein
VGVLKKNTENKLALMGLRPVVFVPRTRWRTWGTRPFIGDPFGRKAPISAEIVSSSYRSDGLA